MANKRTTRSNLSLRQSIKIAAEMKEKTRKELISKISEFNYLRLCRLGFITEGATIDSRDNRVAVWKLTSRADIYEADTNAEIPYYIKQRASAIIDIENYLK